MDRKLESDVVDRTNSFAPHLLFVAFGNPKQEIWIHKNLSKLNIGSAMAVGGTLCYIAGLVALPPKWMESLGLEWLWRLIHEPKRIKRIWNAVVVFPIKVFQSKLSQ
jgi:N-acetylglucosaminyldiphosphoundecaprenol N-acetyl-beta-D-mannosaminyltransferase